MANKENFAVIVNEEACRDLISAGDAFAAVQGVFSAMAAGKAKNFPVVRESIGYADALYGFKSGFDEQTMTLGVKAGGYWPQNLTTLSMTNHQSTVLLFDPDTGRLRAVVGGNHLTALRTAAATAVSIAHLSRPQSKILGIMGAGHQSEFQVRAAVETREFTTLLGWNRSAEGLVKLREVAADCGLSFSAVSPDEMASSADVIITITSSHNSLLIADKVRPGLHIAAMGTDTKGKQELDANIMTVASVFTDAVEQSITIGEAQHAVSAKLISREAITPIGDVINAVHHGRRDDAEITVFDGTGVGLQDLALAQVAVERALKAGKAVFAPL